MGKIFLRENGWENKFGGCLVEGRKGKKLVKPKYFFSVKSYDKISTIFLI